LLIKLRRRNVDLADMASRPRRPAGWGWVLCTSIFSMLWAAFFATNLRRWGPTGRPVGLATMELELVVAILYLVRRQPIAVSRSPLAWVAAAAGGFGMLLARPAYDPIGGLEPLYVALQFAGMVVALLTLLKLGRSFGIVAANRGLTTTGPYGIVRHPLYLGYVATMTGYLFENPSPPNLLVFGAVGVAQVVRIGQEERCLDADPDYRAYRQRVRFRLLPYVY
jgi:protein-S-isoprenylcysteine O-methyltransferase Ste14